MTQTKKRTLYRRYTEKKAREAGIEFTQTNKKALVEWMLKELERETKSKVIE